MKGKKSSLKGEKFMKAVNKNERRERIGNTVFLVRSHFNSEATESAENLLLRLLESKIKANHREEQIA
jgi:hypothetical protein